MAVIEDTKGCRVTLAPQALVGRAPHCHPRIEDPRVSWDHARIGWARDTWWLRDLDSTNGTWVNDRRLSADARVQLSVGQSIAFGHRDLLWRVASVDSPRFRLRQLPSGEVICPDRTLVALPCEDEPSITLCCGADGWCLDDSGLIRSIVDQEILTVGGQTWQVERPPFVEEMSETRAEAEGRAFEVSDAHLSLVVSPDREQVPVTVQVGGRSYTLPSRAHHELLLVLAESRVRERAQTSSEAEAGWIAVEDTARATAAETSKLNLDIYRLRREFEGLGLKDPHRIVERRPTKRQIRVGTGRLELKYVH